MITPVWASRPTKPPQATKRRAALGKARKRKERMRTLLGGPKERKANKACQEAMMVFRRVVFALTSPTKVQARTFTKTKAVERIKKEKAEWEPILNPDCQPQKHPMKKDMAAPGNQTIGLPVITLTIPGLQMPGGSAQRPILRNLCHVRAKNSISSSCTRHA